MMAVPIAALVVRCRSTAGLFPTNASTLTPSELRNGEMGDSSSVTAPAVQQCVAADRRRQLDGCDSEIAVSRIALGLDLEVTLLKHGAPLAVPPHPPEEGTTHRRRDDAAVFCDGRGCFFPRDRQVPVAHADRIGLVE
jgi:hypothetical protein